MKRTTALRPQCLGAFMAMVGITLFADTDMAGAATPQAFYSHTSGPPPGDGFVWGNGGPDSPNELPADETFETPDLRVKYGNFTGWSTYFNTHYFDALGNDLEQSGHIDREAWWGGAGGLNPRANLGFTDTLAGGIESLSFDLAWATLLKPSPDALSVRVNDYIRAPGGPKLEATLEVNLPDEFVVHTYSHGRGGRVELDVSKLVDDLSGEPLSQIEDVWVELDAISEGFGPSMSIFAIDNVSINRVPAFAADFNRDGAVDSADLIQWQGDFGQTARSDADDDGDSDGADFLAWQRQLGPSAITVSGQSVPESSAATLLLIGVVVAMLAKRAETR